MPKFYMIFTQKIIFPDFFFLGGGTCPLLVSCPRLLSIWAQSLKCTGTSTSPVGRPPTPQKKSGTQTSSPVWSEV